MKKLLVLLMTLIIGTSAFAVDVDTLVKSSKYTSFIMMQEDCSDEEVIATTKLMLINMNEKVLDYIPTSEPNWKYTNWSEEETTNFIDTFLWFLYATGKNVDDDNAYDIILLEGIKLVKAVLPTDINYEEVKKIVYGAYIKTLYDIVGE